MLRGLIGVYHTQFSSELHSFWRPHFSATCLTLATYQY